MILKIDRKSKEPLYLQIKKEIEFKILNEIYPKGFKLLSERKLAELLQVNRSTTIKAYEILKDLNLIESKIGVGTYVIYEKELSIEDNIFNEIYWDTVMGSYSFRDSVNIMSKIMNNTNTDEFISFSGGFPSRDMYPYDEIRNIANSVLKENDIFFQSPVRGTKGFLEVLKNHVYSNKHINCNTSEIIITSGAQQALNLIIQTFVKSGDNILIENPSFFGAIQLFRKINVNFIPIDILSGKYDMNFIEYNLKNKKIKFMYFLPNFQNPTGISMSIEDRKNILYLSKKYRVPIIEEDPYGELYYDKYLPSLKSLDKDNFVIHVGTFSKTLSPGFRIGYIVADKVVIRKLSLLNQFIDIHANTISQKIIMEFIKNGNFNMHLAKMRYFYKGNRDLMISKLKYAKLDYFKPHGGYYIWVKLPKNINVDKLLSKSIKNGIDFIPGEFFFLNPKEGQNYIRLNFTYSSKEKINKGMDIILKLLKL